MSLFEAGPHGWMKKPSFSDEQIKQMSDDELEAIFEKAFLTPDQLLRGLNVFEKRVVELFNSALKNFQEMLQDAELDQEATKKGKKKKKKGSASSSSSSTRFQGMQQGVDVGHYHRVATVHFKLGQFYRAFCQEYLKDFHEQLSEKNSLMTSYKNHFSLAEYHLSQAKQIFVVNLFPREFVQVQMEQAKLYSQNVIGGKTKNLKQALQHIWSIKELLNLSESELQRMDQHQMEVMAAQDFPLLADILRDILKDLLMYHNKLINMTTRNNLAQKRTKAVADLKQMYQAALRADEDQWTLIALIHDLDSGFEDSVIWDL
eukprot:TRINITY_DN567_c2_g2_i1.p1 TRINITY_DN567_c2_g2~~TRINITY_DN567_c2_g2_i1.p1  ORF type:complete len:317 (-),score=133.51 TRINITY_DN567_c2_g2_i1:131-1081(-)